MRSVQRRLRRRPNGGARTALGRSTNGSTRAHDEHEQHPFARQRQAHHQPHAGHRSGVVLRDPRAQIRSWLLPPRHALHRQEGSRLGLAPRCVRIARRSAYGLRQQRSHAALFHQSARHRPRKRPSPHGHHHGRPLHHLRDLARGLELRLDQQDARQKGPHGPHRRLLPQAREQGHRLARRPFAQLGLRVRHQVRLVDLHGSHGDSRCEEDASQRGAGRSERVRRRVPRRSHHGRRALQQGGRQVGRRG